VAGIIAFQPPSAIARSIGFTPAASILINTWPGPACGSGTSVGAGAAPYSLTVIACISSTPLLLVT
jgi:hypothetical protein